MCHVEFQDRSLNFVSLGFLMLPLRSMILFTLKGSLDTMVQIFASIREPITERGGSSRTMMTSMRHTEAVCLYLWIQHGSRREATF